jgi:hypothetical protein
MNNIHDELLKQIINAEQETPSGSPIFARDAESLKRLLFLNFRKSSIKEQGLRLTHIGLSTFSAFFESYTVPLPSHFQNEHFKSKDLLILDRTCKLPYYVDKTKAVFFERDLAILLKLNDFNLDNLAL